METDRIVIRGKVVRKLEVLNNPDHWHSEPMICLSVGNDYMDGLYAYGREIDLSDLEITLAPWPIDPTERAKEFFFVLRDRFVEASQGGVVDRQYKDHIYRSCIKEFDFKMPETGHTKRSIKDLNKKELWLCTELMHQWCTEAGCDLRDLKAVYKQSQAYLKETE